MFLGLQRPMSNQATYTGNADPLEAGHSHQPLGRDTAEPTASEHVTLPVTVYCPILYCLSDSRKQSHLWPEGNEPLQPLRVKLAGETGGQGSRACFQLVAQGCTWKGSQPSGLKGRCKRTSQGCMPWGQAPPCKPEPRQHLPEEHSLQVNRPSGLRVRPRQARWKAPQQGPSHSSRLPVFSHSCGGGAR